MGESAGKNESSTTTATTASKWETSPNYRLLNKSPTLKVFAKLSIYDAVNKITPIPSHEKEGHYIFGNLPIKWVCLCGIIISHDNKETRFVITLDDGSGETVDVISDKDHSPAVDYPSPDLSEYNVGETVRVKGTMIRFKYMKQMLLRKIERVENMRDELIFLKEVLKWKKLVRKPLASKRDAVMQVERYMEELWPSRPATTKKRR